MHPSKLDTSASAPVGATSQADGTTRFRVWAPTATRVTVEIRAPDGEPPRSVTMRAAENEHFEVDAAAPPGSRYHFTLDERGPFADPASRFQPEGPWGPSEVIDPHAFAWTDARWQGPDAGDIVLYEMHVGTFTPEGTWRAAAEHLEWLAALGVTAIEMLPVADFPGRFGWGYDGVCLFAPTRLYGRPDDLRHFVDRAHTCGISVILDVVYNHLGAEGCQLAEFSREYFSREPTDWGPALNFDPATAAPVRELVIQNAAYWIREFHVDGLRLDATQFIIDSSEPHMIREIVDAARRAAGDRRVWMIGESEPQRTHLVRPPSAGGFGLDALWNDDYHHSAVVAATGLREAYCTDYYGAPQEFVSLAKYGFLYQGQRYSWQRAPRGTSTRGLPPRTFICFLENHDQVANSVDGARLHHRTSPGRLRALTALTLLGPWTPMLFQGEEFASSAPFLYFADHEPGLAAAVVDGRRQFLSQFPSARAAMEGRQIDPPHEPATFERSRLDHAERERHAAVVELHRSLLRLRRTDPTLARHGSHGLDGAVLGPEAFVLRFFGAAGDGDEEPDRLLVVNLGRQLELPILPEPLVAPPSGRTSWRTIWSSDDPANGGPGTTPLEGPHGWRLPAESAYVLA